MQQWEYAELTVFYKTSDYNRLRADLWRIDSGGKFSSVSGTYGELLALLSRDGWELVTSHSGQLGVLYSCRLMFKRPIEAA